MGMLGRYIDSLDAAAKDRIIQNQDWWNPTKTGSHGACLVNAAQGLDCYEFPNLMAQKLEPDVADQYDVLAYRARTPAAFSRFIRALKLRAGRPQPVLTPPMKASNMQYTLSL